MRPTAAPLLWSVLVVFALAGCDAKLRDVEPDGRLRAIEGCLEFGLVAPGTVELRELPLRNEGEGTLEIFEAVVVDGPFFVSASPGAIPAGEAASLRLGHAPEVAGAWTGTVRIRSSDPVAPVQEFCLRATSGGPDLRCAEASIDFGEVPLGIERVAWLRCGNQGSPGIDGRLHVARIRSDDAQLRAIVRNEDGTSGTARDGYESGTSFTLEVRYLPEERGSFSGRLAIESDDALEPTLEIEVGAAAIDLAPCDLELPEAIDFGLVAPGGRGNRKLALHNRGSARCILWDVGLAPESDPAFSVRGSGRVEIAPGETIEVDAFYRPTEAAPHAAGAVAMQISDPARPERTVPLRGRSLPPCLAFVPELLSFGQVAPGCGSSPREIRLVNTCAEEVEVQTLELPGAPFVVEGAPALPHPLPGGSALRISARMQPEAAGGPAEAELLASTHDGHSVARATLAGEATENPELIEGFVQRNLHRVDLLWVIDNSASMQPYQTVLAEGMETFLHYALDSRLDFHVGVTTTGLEPASQQQLACPGGVEGGEDGRLFPVDGSTPRILTAETEGLVESWRSNVAVGTCNGAERAFDAALRALSPPVIDSADDPRHPEPADGNLGFLREDAHLAVVFLTDEEEQSGLPVEHYFDRLAAIKGAVHPELLSIHALAGDPGEGCTGPRGSARPGDRFAALASLSGGLLESVCSSDWSDPLQRIGAAAFGLQVRFPLVNACRDRNGDGRVTDGAGEVEVRVGGVVLPSDDGQGRRAWRYLDGAIEFYWPHVPPAGREIEVRCTPACL